MRKSVQRYERNKSEGRGVDRPLVTHLFIHPMYVRLAAHNTHNALW